MRNLIPTPTRALLLASIIALISLALSACPSSSSPTSIPKEQPELEQPLPAGSEAEHPLKQHLSSSAQLILPSDPSYPLLAHRWSSNPLHAPHPPSLIVLPTTPSDISHTIRYANAHNLPFLATTGTHGTTRWLSTLRTGGVLIHMRNMTRFDLSEDGKTAVLGGGLLSGEVVSRLWERGKQTTTGVCQCVSFSGPALGGGHGWLQGRYGLVADQVVSATVVLGSGEVVHVSDSDRGDLFWGVRGAGHNLGVVAEWRVRVHDVEEGRGGSWAYEMFKFEGGRLEEVYELANGMLETQPEYAVHWSAWGLDDEVDPDEPVISVSVFYNGPMEECHEYTRPIRDLGPVAYSSGVTDYPGLSAALGVDFAGVYCQDQRTAYIRAIDVDRYDIAALRNWFDVYSEMLAAEPALAKSVCMLEGYSVQAVQAVPADSTAFPHRHQRLMLSPFTFYDEIGNRTLDDEAARWSKAMGIAAFGTAQRRSYVNYGYGDETLQALYGYEPWRLEKLRGLKRKYDPDNRFRFFAPLEQDGDGGVV
ncbi:6-hydroxy-D-nicotine oxidase [Parachaetomium inaequale]|uniref:6-hydroxy-D-nicotine oxidase n=1 Tax=Parachaetomium inaequale TaxID=2588326 RepID=A0AAN6SQM4_9PEZI|nr:6-hydroxy-D-nicotine oxidase [Parachaetomium inaequale]